MIKQMIKNALKMMAEKLTLESFLILNLLMSLFIIAFSLVLIFNRYWTNNLDFGMITLFNVIICLLGVGIFSGIGLFQIHYDTPSVSERGDLIYPPESGTSQFASEGVPSTKSIENHVEIHFINVGAGDATLINTTDATILIDSGRPWGSDVTSYLRKQDIDELDLLIITHPHGDHVGQAAPVIENFHVEEVWMSGQPYRSSTLEAAVDSIERHDVNYHEPQLANTYTVGPVKIKVLHPEELDSDPEISAHDNVIVTRMTFEETSVLFTGDAEMHVEKEMIERGEELEADIYQVGYHGSSRSSSEKFLSEINPDIAVYSIGPIRPQYTSAEYRDSETISRINDSGAKVYGTDVHGTTVVKIKPNNKYKICTEIENPSLNMNNLQSENQTQ